MNVSRDTLTAVVTAVIITAVVTLWLHVVSSVDPAELEQQPSAYELILSNPKPYLFMFATVLVSTFIIGLSLAYIPEGWLDPFTDHER